MALPYPSMSFSPFEILTAQEMNNLVANDQALAAGTGLNDNSIAYTKFNYSSLPQMYVEAGDSTNFNTSDKNLTNSSLTFNIPKALKVLLTYGGTLRNATGEITMYPNVNGVSFDSTMDRATYISTATNGQLSASKSKVVDLPAGSNTILLRGRANGSNASNAIYGAYWNVVIIG